MHIFGKHFSNWNNKNDIEQTLCVLRVGCAKINWGRGRDLKNKWGGGDASKYKGQNFSNC